MPRDVRLASRRGGVLRRERRPAADRGRMGGSRTRRRRQALALGRRASRRDPRDLRAGHRRPVAGRVAPRGGCALRRARPGRQRLGVDRRRRRPRRLVPERAGRAALLGPAAGAPVGAGHLRRLPRRRRQAALGLRLGRGARRRLRDRPRPGRDAAARRRRGRLRARADSRHERASTRSSSPRAAPTLLRTGRRRTTIPSPSSTGTTRPPSARGPEAGCRRRPNGRRPRAAPTGARTRGATRRTSASPRSATGSSTAPRHRSARTLTAPVRTVCRTWPGTSGSGRRRSTRPASACSAAARSRAPRLAWARCTMRSHSRPGRRQSHIGFRVARGAA